MLMGHTVPQVQGQELRRCQPLPLPGCATASAHGAQPGRPAPRRRRTVTISSVEVFTLVHEFSPRRGPSDAWGSSHAYCLVKITDSDGAAGWGETYVRPGLPATVVELAAPLIGRSALDAIANWTMVWGSGEFPFAASAIAIALDDLRGKLLGVSIADLYGGRRRDRVRAYAATQGYVEGVDPEASWVADAREAAAAGLHGVQGPARALPDRPGGRDPRTPVAAANWPA